MTRDDLSAAVLEPVFLDSPNGRLLVTCILPPQDVSAKGGVLLLPAFGEEMNKSRRMFACQARALARLGYRAHIPDLPGCGDSEGSFEDFTWDDWVSAARLFYDHLDCNTAGAMIVLGHRMGALLAAELLSTQDTRIDRTVFWQPVADGKSIVSSLLRLAKAGQLLGNQGEDAEAQDPRLELQRGDAVEIGGYLMTPALVSSIETRSLAEIPSGSCGIDWFEIGSRTRDEPTFAAARQIEALTLQGIEVNWAHVVGDPFWSTVEISECQALIDATCRAIEKH